MTQALRNHLYWHAVGDARWDDATSRYTAGRRLSEKSYRCARGYPETSLSTASVDIAHTPMFTASASRSGVTPDVASWARTTR